MRVLMIILAALSFATPAIAAESEQYTPSPATARALAYMQTMEDLLKASETGLSSVDKMLQASAAQLSDAESRLKWVLDNWVPKAP